MSVETRHTEKSSYYQMLLVSHGLQKINQALYAMKATMDPEDVELVEKQVMELLKEMAEQKND